MSDERQTLLPISFGLTELVRTLEERQFLFERDPQEMLAEQASGFEEYVCDRARALDASGRLQQTLARTESRLAAIIWLVTFMWFGLGVSAALSLLHTEAVNFFYVLASVLGLNWVMLSLWLFWLTQKKAHVSWLNPLVWMKSRDAVTQAALHVYEERLQARSMRWFWGAVTHRFWLGTLGGLLVGLLILLSVRQYTFSWQSTLLGAPAFSALVAALAWLPAHLGLAVPDAQSVAHSQTIGHVTEARQWAILLIASLVLYGLTPRILALLICRWRLNRLPPELPLDKPYYQRLKRLWRPPESSVVVDADTHQERIVAQRAPTLTPDSFALAAVLEWPDAPATWHEKVKGLDWYYWGVIDSRTQKEKLLAELARHPVNLLLGVRLSALPERGSLRLIEQLRAQAQGGFQAALIGSDGADNLVLRHQQWAAAFDERHIDWVDLSAVHSLKKDAS